jgi:hypothetical protein
VFGDRPAAYGGRGPDHPRRRGMPRLSPSILGSRSGPSVRERACNARALNSFGEAVDRLINPQAPNHLVALAFAGMVSFGGNLVAAPDHLAVVDERSGAATSTTRRGDA